MSRKFVLFFLVGVGVVALVLAGFFLYSRSTKSTNSPLLTATQTAPPPGAITIHPVINGTELELWIETPTVMQISTIGLNLTIGDSTQRIKATSTTPETGEYFSQSNWTLPFATVSNNDGVVGLEVSAVNTTPAGASLDSRHHLVTIQLHEVVEPNNLVIVSDAKDTKVFKKEKGESLILYVAQ